MANGIPLGCLAVAFHAPYIFDVEKDACFPFGIGGRNCSSRLILFAEHLYFPDKLLVFQSSRRGCYTVIPNDTVMVLFISIQGSPEPIGAGQFTATRKHTP